MQYNRTTKQQETLLLKNWIKAGFVFVKPLRFVDGVLDETYIYDKVIYKKNIYCEILTIKKALIPCSYSVPCMSFKAILWIKMNQVVIL